MARGGWKGGLGNTAKRCSPHSTSLTPHSLLLLFLALLWQAFAQVVVAQSPPLKPHVLVVFADDLGWGDLSCYGGAEVPTPRLDRLAAEGVRFTQFYVASPICSASRCGLLTGQFPARWRITSYLQTRAGNRECEQVDYLDPRAPSLVRTFHDAGYATAHIGKWHLGGGRDVTDAPPFSAYGYDLGLGTYESPEPAAPLGVQTTPWSDELEPQQVPRHQRTQWMVDQAIEFARRHGDQPWLIQLWLDDVHTPYRPSDEQLGRVADGIGTRQYRAVLQETDRQLGRLLDGLRELSVEERTLVMFAGDNGPQPSFERRRTAGLRGMKWSLYEGGIRTPLIVRWPGVVPAGRVNSQTVIGAVDIFPTLCRLAAVAAPSGVEFDGEDLSAAVRGAEPSRTRPLYWEYGRKPPPAGAAGLRAFPYPSEPDSKSPNVAVRDGDWKLLVQVSDGQVDDEISELYDLAADPHESRNLAAERPEVAARLRRLAVAWRRNLP